MQGTLFNNNNNNELPYSPNSINSSVGNQVVTQPPKLDAPNSPNSALIVRGKLLVIHQGSVEKIDMMREVPKPPWTLYVHAEDEIGANLLRKLSEKSHVLKSIVQRLDLEVEPDSFCFYEVSLADTPRDHVDKIEIVKDLREWIDKGLLYKQKYARTIGTEVMR